MFYRVDYLLAVLFAGFFAGVLFSKRAADVAASRLARGYYVAIAILLVLRTSAFACTMLTPQLRFANAAGGFLGDFGSFLFGGVFGLASRRNDAREFLEEPSILSALRMALAFTFSLAGIGKAFSMAPMTEFFTQSGYSLTFLKFIIIGEIFGAVGLLLPWALLPALMGLAVDMFGAVLTHIHNGDPLNDSTGAIGALIRIGAIGLLWALRPNAEQSRRTVGRSLWATGGLAAACLLIAYGGSVAMRHFNPPIPATTLSGSRGELAKHSPRLWGDPSWSAPRIVFCRGTRYKRESV